MIKMIQGGRKLTRTERLVRSVMIEKKAFSMFTGITYIPGFLPHVDAKIEKIVEEIAKTKGGRLI